MINPRKAPAWLLSALRKGRGTGLVLWLAVIGLIGLTLAPVMCITAAARRGDHIERIMLCTERGIEEVAVEEGSAPDSQPPEHSTCAACVISTARSNYLLAPSASFNAPEPLLDGMDELRLFPQSTVPERYFLAGRESRAPPGRA